MPACKMGLPRRQRPPESHFGGRTGHSSEPWSCVRCCDGVVAMATRMGLGWRQPQGMRFISAACPSKPRRHFSATMPPHPTSGSPEPTNTGCSQHPPLRQQSKGVDMSAWGRISLRRLLPGTQTRHRPLWVVFCGWNGAQLRRGGASDNPRFDPIVILGSRSPPPHRCPPRTTSLLL